MIADQLQRLSEIAAELERGQAAQPLTEFVGEVAQDFSSARRAILLRVLPTPAFPVPVPPGAALRRHAAVGPTGWDWLTVVHAGHAVQDLGNWNRLVGFSPLVVVCIEAADKAALQALQPLIDALAQTRHRFVTLALCELPPGFVPGPLLPAHRVPGFDPAADWMSAFPPAPADWLANLNFWMEAFCVERTAQAITARLDALRQRTTLHRSVNEQRQAAIMSQRDLGAGRAALDRARDACLLALENTDKEIAETSRLFLAANGEGTTQLKSLVGNFGADIIHEERRPKVIVLTVVEGELRRLVQQMEALFWANGKRVADRADRKVAEIVQEFTRELAGYHPEAPAPAAERFDTDKLRKAIGAMLHTNLSYRGELPVKGFFERLQASRQIVFLMVGLLSLAGASAIARSPLVIFLTLTIFSFMLFKTSRDFRQEAIEAREKELERLLELVRTQMRQQLQELETVRVNLWRDHLQGVRRAVAAALDQSTREVAARQARELEDDRQKIQLKQRALDKAQRDHMALDQRLQAVLAPLRTGRLKAEQAVLQNFRSASTTSTHA